ncbi:MAG: metabolite traffic protein EboE [Verrucomicrobiales bacterium]|nr:metabolite traffic protein EboE [Verrucomicrobiales bacterium]
MRLKNDIHLAYCTNIHRGETWTETFHGLQEYTNQVRQRVCPEAPYGIGLRLSANASQELTDHPERLDEFKRWMDEHQSYVFTINGFPYGTFHGSRVKEQVYVPDWTSGERLAYTTQLFDLIDKMAPAGEEVSVSTLPGSFKEFISQETEKEQIEAMVKNLRACSDHIERLRDAGGRDIHLGLEPEPLGFFETSSETVSFFERLHEGAGRAESERLQRNLGVNYDTCHLAVEFEEPADAIGRLRAANIRISKIHLSSALRLKPEAESIERLKSFHDEVYLHQVIVGGEGKAVRRFRDLPEALEWSAGASPQSRGDEWRVHFHVPIHAQPEALFDDTRDHIPGVLAILGEDPGWCSHFEMETYTWEVLPEEIRSRDVVDQLVSEYDWCLNCFEKKGLA